MLTIDTSSTCSSVYIPTVVMVVPLNLFLGSHCTQSAKKDFVCAGASKNPC